jgi:hypothetical protein
MRFVINELSWFLSVPSPKYELLNLFSLLFLVSESYLRTNITVVAYDMTFL